MTHSSVTEAAQPSSAPPLLEACNIDKHYPGVLALDDFSFALQPGEVHILFGENGAGKSTLISILAGANQPSAGQIKIKGQPVTLDSVHHARELGISAVFQEFSLIPQMTVAENIFLGAEEHRSGWLRKSAMRNHARDILQELDFHLDPDARIDHLTRAEQQMVEIAKAFRSDLSILILDEPTASLTQHETEQLFKLITKLQGQNVGIIYITHRMAEIRAIGDSITVLRDGRFIDTVDAKTTAENDLVQLMTGRVVGQVFPEVNSTPGEVILTVTGLSLANDLLTNASLNVRRGEIVGLAGLVGSGKSEAMQACFGALDPVAGSIRFKGEDLTGAAIATMLERGLLYLPADRRVDGLMMMRAARENVSLTSLRLPAIANAWQIKRRGEVAMVEAITQRLDLRPARIERQAEHFSGGNQQKIMLARSLTRSFDLIIFDEPTVGVDVGTRAAIYKFIAELCEQGVAIILVSSDLPEILNLSHRVYVFYRGQIQAELEGAAITEANVLSHFFASEAA